MVSSMIDSSKTVVLVTGATGVIGGAIARELAGTPGYEIVVLARDEGRAKAVDAIRSSSGNGDVRYVLADLSRRQSIQSLAEVWKGPLHVLVNDAGVAPRKRETTPEGIELTFATNVLGYLWMTEAFAPHLERSAPPARIVNVASYWAGELDLDDLEFHQRRFDNHTAYRQSKQANRMLTVALAERLAHRGITVNACHPGDPASVLSRNLGFGGSQSPEEAARTPAMLARGELGADTTGRYFEHGHEADCRFATDRGAVQRLYDICRAYA
jgi:retinol dehydrogenase-12